MFKAFIFVRYLRIISNYLEKREISYPNHKISMADLIAISVETLRIDSMCSLENFFIELICINP